MPTASTRMMHRVRPARRQDVPRSRTEQAEDMRRRLMAAALDCLSIHGYARTTVSRIARHAGVSRGAHRHHYPSKSAILGDAGAYWLLQFYVRLNQIILTTAATESGLRAFVEQAGNALFQGRWHPAYIELLVASRHDPALAQALHSASQWLERAIRSLVQPHFGAATEAAGTVHEMLLLTRWLLRGTVLEAESGGADAEQLRRCLRLCGADETSPMESERP